jgi:ribosome-binding protein aMBF1 (putative translation factor)
MTKPNVRPLSQHSQLALQLLGQLIREGRLVKGFSTTDLAARAGISRALLQRIERGEAGCSIGACFEVAAVCGVSLFEPDENALSKRLSTQTEKLALLPKAVRRSKLVVHDDF